MGCKIIVTSPAGQLPVLEEVKAQDEAQLQELLGAVDKATRLRPCCSPSH